MSLRTHIVRKNLLKDKNYYGPISFTLRKSCELKGHFKGFTIAGLITQLINVVMGW